MSAFILHGALIITDGGVKVKLNSSLTEIQNFQRSAVREQKTIYAAPMILTPGRKTLQEWKRLITQSFVPPTPVCIR